MLLPISFRSSYDTPLSNRTDATFNKCVISSLERYLFIVIHGFFKEIDKALSFKCGSAIRCFIIFPIWVIKTQLNNGGQPIGHILRYISYEFMQILS